MFISQTCLTYFNKWLITCKIQILNLIKCGSGICNRCDQRLSILASLFFSFLSPHIESLEPGYLNICPGYLARLRDISLTMHNVIIVIFFTLPFRQGSRIFALLSYSGGLTPTHPPTHPPTGVVFCRFRDCAI
jgi:hypothetical protein